LCFFLLGVFLFLEDHRPPEESEEDEEDEEESEGSLGDSFLESKEGIVSTLPSSLWN
jgi:hypothetical protein